MKYCIDASSFICLWNDTYPRETFPTLYTELGQISSRIVLIQPIFLEIKEEEELDEWLEDIHLASTNLEDKHERESLDLSKKYEIDLGSSGSGASQTDIKLISFAKVEKITLVTEEKHQTTTPDKVSNYKIPLICKQEQVRCVNFLKFLNDNEIRV